MNFIFVEFLCDMVREQLRTDNLYSKIVSPEFLYYSWIWLRKEKYFLKNFFRYTEEPLSKLWFTNVSYMLESGKYNYIVSISGIYYYNWISVGLKVNKLINF